MTTRKSAKSLSGTLIKAGQDVISAFIGKRPTPLSGSQTTTATKVARKRTSQHNRSKAANAVSQSARTRNSARTKKQKS